MIRTFEEAMQRRRAVGQVKALYDSNERNSRLQEDFCQAVAELNMPKRPWWQEWWSRLCRIRPGK